MKSFVYISVMFALCGCKPTADSAWQMSSRLSFDGYPINWQAESIKGCEQCEFKKERLLEPDGVSDVITVFQQGHWRVFVQNLQNLPSKTDPSLQKLQYPMELE